MRKSWKLRELRKFWKLTYVDSSKSFEPWEDGEVINLVNRYRVLWPCLARESFKNLVQECMMAWWLAKKKHDPETGWINGGLMKAVVVRALRDKKDYLLAEKRKAALWQSSLDETISGSESSTTFLELKSNDKDYADNLQASIDRNGDIEMAKQKLSPKQLQLCCLIEQGLSITEAGRVLEVHRDTCYEELRRVKAIFEAEGLR